jgi:hypothetical protein
MANTGKLKRYTLDDGTVTNVRIVSEAIGITINNARTRLSNHSDPLKVFKDKQTHKPKRSPDSYKMRQIMSRGMFDEMYVKAFKSI